MWHTYPNMFTLIIRRRIQCYVTPLYLHGLISNLLHSSVDLLFIYQSLNERDRWHQIGLQPSRAYPHPSSMCAALLLEKNIRVFRIRCHNAASEDSTNCLLRNPCLMIAQKSFARRSRSTLQALFFPSDHGHMYVHYRHHAEMRSFQERNVPLPSLFRSNNYDLGISPAEVE